ncbi:hypothetical protein D3C72_1341470 [compost metagenome]
MPAAFEVGQRIRYEAMALCVEIIELNFAQIRDISRRIAASGMPPKIPRATRTQLISLAWSIVDQADILRLLVQAEGAHLDTAQSRAFLDIAGVARDLRNWMDHLPGRLDGYIKQAQFLPPTHGALSFTVVEPEDAEAAIASGKLRQYRTIVILSAAAHRPMQVEGAPHEYVKFEVPTDHFVLQAFGLFLDLGRISKIAGEFCDSLGVAVEGIVLEAASSEVAKQAGCSPEEFLKPVEMLGGTLVMTATLDELAAAS